MTHNRSSFIDALAQTDMSKRELELLIAKTAWGHVLALRTGKHKLDLNRLDPLFNTSNFEAIRRAKLSPELKRMFEWGMQLIDVARLAPAGLDESFDAIVRFAREITDRPTQRRRAAGRAA